MKIFRKYITSFFIFFNVFIYSIDPLSNDEIDQYIIFVEGIKPTSTSTINFENAYQNQSFYLKLETILPKLDSKYYNVDKNFFLKPPSSHVDFFNQLITMEKILKMEKQLRLINKLSNDKLLRFKLETEFNQKKLEKHEDQHSLKIKGEILINKINDCLNPQEKISENLLEDKLKCCVTHYVDYQIEIENLNTKHNMIITLNKTIELQTQPISNKTVQYFSIGIISLSILIITYYMWSTQNAISWPYHVISS